MANIFSNIKERVLYISEYKQINKEIFFEELGVSYGNFKGKAKESALSSDVLAKIITKYPDINIEWLLNGSGKITKDPSYMVNEPQSIYKLKTDRTINHNQIIPLYNIEATAGIVTLFKDADNYEPIDTISIPNLPKCDGAVYVTGDSMYPLLKSGDIVIYKQVNDIQNNIYYGEMYLLSIRSNGDDYVTVKFIQKSDKGEKYVKLVSQNQHHQPKDILVSKIDALALIKASVRINSM